MIAGVIGIVVGYLLAIPPGPIGVATARLALSTGRGSARWLAMGAGLLDMLYCGMAAFASSGLSNLAIATSSMGAAGRTFQAAVVVAIVGVGVYQYRNPVSLTLEQTNEENAQRPSRLASRGTPFAIGVGYAVANLANPTFIPSLVLVTTFIASFSLFDSTPLSLTLFAVGFGIGNFLWLETLARLVLRYHAHVPERIFVLIQRTMSGVVILAGLTLGFKLLYLVPST